MKACHDDIRFAAPWQFRKNREESVMFKWAIIFAVISIVAGLFGFTGIATGAAGIAKVLFVLFLVAFLIVLALALLGIGAVVK
jgi:uncharacterized membrane protein YtjA (UPF0391 family)